MSLAYRTRKLNSIQREKRRQVLTPWRCFPALSFCYPAHMDKHKILKEAQAELQRHTWGTFVDDGLTVALGGNGVVVPGLQGLSQAP